MCVCKGLPWFPLPTSHLPPLTCQCQLHRCQDQHPHRMQQCLPVDPSRRRSPPPPTALTTHIWTSGTEATTRHKLSRQWMDTKRTNHGHAAAWDEKSTPRNVWGECGRQHGTTQRPWQAKQTSLLLHLSCQNHRPRRDLGCSAVKIEFSQPAQKHPFLSPQRTRHKPGAP